MRAAADLRLRPRGHWDRQFIYVLLEYTFYVMHRFEWCTARFTLHVKFTYMYLYWRYTNHCYIRPDTCIVEQTPLSPRITKLFLYYGAVASVGQGLLNVEDS